MATVFETRLIGNIGKDADVRSMDNGNLLAINFPVAHNKNWKDKRTGALKTNDMGKLYDLEKRWCKHENC